MKLKMTRKEKRRAKRLARLKRSVPELVAVRKLGPPHPDYDSNASDSFYRSTDWRQLRYLALKNCGGRCQCCGAMASDGLSLHVDHIIPRYKAPHLSLSLSNLQVLCGDCNIGKGAWDSTDWRQHWKSI